MIDLITDLAMDIRLISILRFQNDFQMISILFFL